MKDCLAFLADVKDFLNSQNLKSSSPQRSSEDMHIIYDVFAGSVIREGFGKLVRIDLTSILQIPYLRSHLSGEPRIGDWFGL